MGKRTRRMARKAEKRKRNAVSIRGIFSAAVAGFGFINSPDGKSAFVPPSMTGGALDGDTVEAVIVNERDPRGPSARITSILARGRDFVVGMIVDSHTIQPLNKTLPESITVSGGVRGAKRGDWVRSRLLSSGSRFTEKLRCSVEERVGRSATVEGDLAAVAKEFDMPDPYTPEQEAAAEKIVPLDLPRTDLSREITVTIDPADAHDFDDALSIVDGEKEWIIGVHIADLAVFVRPGSLFDRQARRRAFSSYIPAMFRPMLPRTLTHRVSLKEGEVSHAHTVRLHVRKSDGKVISYERMHSFIKVNRRLNYDEVQQVMDGAAEPKRWGKRVSSAVKLLIEAAAKMRKKRKKEECFLEINTSEAHIRCNEETFAVESIELRRQRPADQLVEECMLAANSAVAEELMKRGIGGIYRIHPEPDPEKLIEFSRTAESILHRSPGDLSDRMACDDFLCSLPDDQRGSVVNQLFLQSMQRARYSIEHGLHFGLGKELYCHFTSPIRRYSDLLVHQQLLACDLNMRLRSKNYLLEAAEEITRKECRNDEAYYAACDRLKLHFLKNEFNSGISKMYEGVIVKVTSGGLICDIPEFALRGFVPQREMRIRTRKQPRPGDVIFLYLESLDFQRGSARFRPAL